MWDGFAFRDDDIIISTYGKCGTTWTQQIVSQLLFDGEEGLPVADMSPWIDLRAPPKEVKLADVEAQTHRRFLKTHLPVEALVFSSKAKYLYVARDGRDIAWSFHNHYLNGSEMMYAMLNETPGLVGPPMPRPDNDVVSWFRTWLENDGEPIWSFWDNVRSWWAIRDLPNVMIYHFNDLKADLEGMMRQIAAFLEIEIEEECWPVLVHHCTFDYMKQHGEGTVPLGGAPWKGGAKTFIHKGVNGRWREMLSDELSAVYEARAIEELGEQCAHWLKTGELPVGS
jgi:aryl sulfotransferase